MKVNYKVKKKKMELTALYEILNTHLDITL